MRQGRRLYDIRYTIDEKRVRWTPEVRGVTEQLSLLALHPFIPFLWYFFFNTFHSKTFFKGARPMSMITDKGRQISVKGGYRRSGKRIKERGHWAWQQQRYHGWCYTPVVGKRAWECTCPEDSLRTEQTMCCLRNASQFSHLLTFSSNRERERERERERDRERETETVRCRGGRCTFCTHFRSLPLKRRRDRKTDTQTDRQRKTDGDRDYRESYVGLPYDKNFIVTTSWWYVTFFFVQREGLNARTRSTSRWKLYFPS